ncbi:N-carbamoyl-D-amino acid amidohydrolase AguB [Methanobrevibacter ruminantium M1]|uniref:N-carbamoyl-D-amino acid amidohydrolase AguB n=1 Tax=Methanobrevibacter ruminantium (strain ATCC 35063 / DSM 1093 / JCM 13430 / OCM 146 / M1) TaxID=634498 RepID=D3E1P3_METRM|nr:carbon-nitrogen hydrolase family protein [Methanobrevibacter ruminantium]ADC46454.1 N-carbamoyl-D-amino acid amidohydrolase AguB [Methanobrevibacter ruminantium M1]
MNKIKIALCQMNVVDNKDENIKKAIEMIKESKKQGADLAILPEMFNCPYENEKFIKYGETLEDSRTLKSISETANEENIYVLAGSVPELVLNDSSNENNLYNTSVFFDNEGKILGKHRKVHLFDIDIKDKIYFKESDTLSAGDDFTIIKTPFARIGIGICYDIRFVELSRILALNGAEILIFPGAFNLTTGPAHWELLFRSRALDNQVYAIGVAPALDKEASYNSYGHSIIVSPWGEVIEELDYDEELKIVELDLDLIKQVREEIPVLKNRRTDLYDINEK